MRFLLCLLLLLPSAAFGAKVTFSTGSPESGESFQRVQSMKLDLEAKMKVNGQDMGSFSQKSLEEDTLTLEVERWSDEGSAATLVYGEATAKETQTMPGGQAQETSEPPVTSGKSYRVERSGAGDPVVAYLSGEGEVPEAERAAVLDDWSDLDDTSDDGMMKELANRKLEVGKALDIDLAEMTKLVGLEDDENLVATKGQAILREVRTVAGKRCGVLELQVTIQGEEDGVVMSMPVLGTMVLELDGMRPHSVEIRGPVTMSATSEESGMTMSMEGTGTVRYSAAYTWKR